MERKKKENIMHIPDEIVFSILGRLPPKSLVKFKCIWKSWESFVNQYKYHNQKLIVLTDTSIQSIDFEADEIEAVDLHIPFKGTHRMLAIASCNGLLCISIESEGLVNDEILIKVREQRIFSRLQRRKQFFFYSPARETYKIFQIPNISLNFDEEITYTESIVSP
ncbi:hypothetical protein ACOSQ4_007665 [Xanthoceras sorbifolium]